MKTSRCARSAFCLAALVLSTLSIPAITFTNDAAIGVGNTNYEGLDIVVTNCTLSVDGAHSFASVQIQNGGTLTHSNLTGLNLTVAGNVAVAAGGFINVNGKGYGGGLGPGVGGSAGSPSSGAGAGYGGIGGMSSSNAVGGATYGSFDQPADFGSGGGAGYAGVGGAGGGAIRIVAGGVVTINGAISANGADGVSSRSGGGSGGSVRITAHSLIGSGTITAHGGAGEPVHGGGGGGGRIAIQCDVNSYAGSTAAYGGIGAKNGGAGTVFTKLTLQNGLLLVDNGGRAGTNTSVMVGNSADVLIRGNASVIPLGAWTVGNLTISSNGLLATLYPTAINLTASGNVTIQAGGGLVADTAGYGAGGGSGVGHAYTGTNIFPCGGGGYGGSGANGSNPSASGGLAYGSLSSPNSLGSGGGSSVGAVLPSVSGAGGGALQLNVAGILQVDGRISANGGNGSGPGGGGGSGGSVWLTAGTLVGSGSITANGGNGVDSIGGGGGGGGRIAIYPTATFFGGVIAAAGGGGTSWGGAGTVFIQTAGQNGQLILDNAGHLGTNTPLQSAVSSDLTVRNGAVGSVIGVSFANLLVASNGWLVPPVGSPTSPTALNVTVSGNATIQAGGGIVADAAGYPAGAGLGAGRYSSSYYPIYPCSGAGHGGYGANSVGDYAAGGTVYDSTASPTGSGSGGGSYPQPGYSMSLGGAGGGAIRLVINGTLQVGGRISANASNGAGSGGGGLGGSIWLTVGTMSGSGSVSANGGSGADTIGGGGGGGRVSVSYTSSSFAGIISAYGGGGANWGGAGTVYTKANSQTYGQLILDNGGNAGAKTWFENYTPASDIIVSGGAIGQLPSYPYSVAARNLQVRTNGVLTMAASTSLQGITVIGDATIDVGGVLSMDGTGYGPGAGNGAGRTISSGIRGGGGHGGFGAANPLGYGGAYDSIQSPAMPGSGGGNGSGSGGLAPYGGAGGGALHLNVIGALAVNGRLSADGKDGGVNSGGGSGGSLWITAGTLTGSGVISANGGLGNGNGGGGGGGRISVAYNANSFAGLISAYGGGGYAQGGTGTIYTKANSQSIGQVLADNGGQSGTNTPLSSAYGMPSSPFNLTVGGDAVVVAQTQLPLLNNLNIGPGGVLTSLSGQSNFLLAVQGNANISSGGAIAVDGKGYSQTNGPGGGASLAGKGSGGGYGGAGGASASGAPGGTNYGSATQPVDNGSGGGAGTNVFFGGSDGGGAIRLFVAGALNVDGSLTANGNPGLQDNSGGGAGGSIWVTAGAVSGEGWISADGGAGELYGGGGGGGGRIAVYSPNDAFIGFVSAVGGAGAAPGASGTFFFSNSLLALAVTGQTPTGVVSSAASFVDLDFNSPVNPSSFTVSDVTLNTPNGPLAPVDLGVSTVTPTRFRVSFTQQTAVGNYTLTVGPQVQDIFGQPMSQVYTGAFSVLLPVIQGTVTGTNGQPVSGVTLQPSGGLSFTTSDTNGNYALGFVPGSTFTVTPSLANRMFVPGSRTYTNLMASVTNENYLMVTTIAPLVNGGLQDTNLLMSWQGISGVTYQLLYSTNLVDWLPYSAPFSGSNAIMQVPVPTGSDPVKFFRVQAGN